MAKDGSKSCQIIIPQNQVHRKSGIFPNPFPTTTLSALHWRNLKTMFSLWNRIKIVFSIHTVPEELKKNQQSRVILDLCSKKNLGWEIAWLSYDCCKTPFSKCFPSTRKQKASIFKFLWFEERFRKALFSWWISADGRPNCRNKAVILNFSVGFLLL